MKRSPFQLSSHVSEHARHLRVGSEVVYNGRLAVVVGFRPGYYGRMVIMDNGIETNPGLDPHFQYRSTSCRTSEPNC